MDFAKPLVLAGMAWAVLGGTDARAELVYRAVNPNRHRNNETGSYGLWLDGFFDGNPHSFVTFDMTDVHFRLDGTQAALQGLVTVNNAPDARDRGRQYTLNLSFEQITAPADLARIHDYNPNYRYYNLRPDGRELVNVSDPGDFASLGVFPRDGTMPFRIGVGADTQEADWNRLGGAGWLTWTHVTHQWSDDMTADLDILLVDNPEPSTLVLALTALAGGGWFARRRLGRWSRR